MPSEWPLPPGLYEPDLRAQAFQSVLERLAFVEELGFDWVSFSEHHYAAKSLDRAASVQLGGPPFPVPDGLRLAAPAAATVSAHLCPGNESRVL